MASNLRNVPHEAVILPNGDIWVPRHDAGEANVPLDDLPNPKPKTTQEKVKDALDKSEANVCPWCDLQLEGLVSLKEHIEKNHMSAVAGDAEQQQAAGEATVRRARAKAK